MRTFIQSALQYARQGFPVFPCRPSEKRPLTPHGFKDATCDEKRIRRWWKQSPNANIGLALDGKSFVLDVDYPTGEKSLAQLEAQHEQLPLTTAVRTGHGGRHIYFSAPSFRVKTSAGKLGSGIDVRGNAGYVLVPPSYTVAEYRWISHSPGFILETVESAKFFYCNGIQAAVGGRKCYQRLTQAPEWLLTLIKGQHRPAQGLGRPQGHKGHTAPLSRAYASATLSGELSHLRQAKVGERNYRLNRAAFRLGQLIATGSLDRGKVETRLTRCALATGLVLAEIEPVIQSGVSAGFVSQYAGR